MGLFGIVQKVEKKETIKTYRRSFFACVRCRIIKTLGACLFSFSHSRSDDHDDDDGETKKKQAKKSRRVYFVQVKVF